MKLQHDCVRDFLLTIEEEISLNESLGHQLFQQKERMQKYSLEDTIYTMLKLKEAGFINAEVLYAENQLQESAVSSLTYTGHAFLNNIRDDGVWKKTKSAASKLSSVSLTILVELASSYIKKELKLS